MVQTLNAIYIYPIKSANAIRLTLSNVEEKGLQFDRRYMLINEEGKFITGRTNPELTQISVELLSTGLVIRAPKMKKLTILRDNFSRYSIASILWSSAIDAQHCHVECDAWFCSFLNQKCQLVHCDESTIRFVENKNTQVSFADGYPLLLINQRSIDQLNSRLKIPVSVLRFRPNIVINGDYPFVEDSWQKIKIGEVEFEVSKPCSRCSFINVDPKTGLVLNNEPLQTLAKFRFYEGNVDFGQNLIALNSGVIKEGDEIQVLETKGSIYYGNIDDYQDNKENILQIKYQNSNVQFSGNNQQLLLDQLAKAAIYLPFSCRRGLCGYCKVKLIAGSVKILKDEALTDAQKTAGYILACSCIPSADITICED